MAMTRREFAGAAGAVVALGVLGCGCSKEEKKSGSGKPKRDTSAKLATEPFDVGALSQYVEPGVYEDFKESKGVWLVSDGKALVALSATCTHNGCTTDYDPLAKGFDCPCHSSTFDLDGANLPGGKAKRPLERCRLEQVGEGSAAVVRVDPTQRYRKDKGEWEGSPSALALGSATASPPTTMPATAPAPAPSPQASTQPAGA